MAVRGKDFFVRQFRASRVVIGGVVSLMDFSSTEILVRVGGGTVSVNGSDLVIERFDENEIIVVGKISGVTTNVR